MAEDNIRESIHVLCNDVGHKIIRYAQEMGLQVVEQPLRTRPACRHWHLTKRGEKGTLELTWCPQEQRMEIQVRRNRAGSWTQAAAFHLREIDWDHVSRAD